MGYTTFQPGTFATVPFVDAFGVSYDDLYFVGGQITSRLYAYTDSLSRNLKEVEPATGAIFQEHVAHPHETLF